MIWCCVTTGRACLGTCDIARQRIEIYAESSPTRRVCTAWHEITHALKAELDIGECDALDEEALCNLIGLGMVSMGPRVLARLHVLLTCGMECVDVMMIAGVDEPIPVVRLSS